MRVSHLIAWAVVLLTAVAPRVAAPADGSGAKLKTQVVKLKVVQLTNNVRDPAIELIQLPAGKIVLKDGEGKEREHTIGPVWMAKFETRWDEYDVFWRLLDLTDEESQKLNLDHVERGKTRTNHPYFAPDGGFDPKSGALWGSPGHDGFPANCIPFGAARRYCAWLSKNTGKKFRLPTEAEWEYACRAGGLPVRPDAKALDAVAWFADNAEDTTHAVGEKAPNAWEFCDMLGNVGEYVIRDPKDDKGVLAGGSYKDEAKDVHSGAREPFSPDWLRIEEEVPPRTDWLNRSVHHVGFRVVMEEE